MWSSAECPFWAESPTRPSTPFFRMNLRVLGQLMFTSHSQESACSGAAAGGGRGHAAVRGDARARAAGARGRRARGLRGRPGPGAGALPRSLPRACAAAWPRWQLLVAFTISSSPHALHNCLLRMPWVSRAGLKLLKSFVRVRFLPSCAARRFLCRCTRLSCSRTLFTALRSRPAAW